MMRARLLFALSLLASVALAHGSQKAQSLGDWIVSSSVTIVIVGSAILALATLVGIFKSGKNPRLRKPLFAAMVVPVLAVTGFLVSSTIYLNLTSWSGGPVHWHADFEVTVCGEHADLVEPGGFSNRVGSPTVHEHGDMRMHIEGVLESREDATVGNFFEQVGGHFEEGHLIIPTDEGMVEVKDGDLCPSGRPGTLKFFVNNVSNGEFGEYVIAPYSLVPPGDSLRIVFDEA